MRPIDPGHEHGRLLELAKDQPEFRTLVARVAMTELGPEFSTRWQLTDEERAAIGAGADVTLALTSFHGWPPARLEVAGVSWERAEVYSREELLRLMTELCELVRMNPEAVAFTNRDDKDGRIAGWEVALEVLPGG